MRRYSDKAWKRLGEVVEQERGRLGMSQVELGKVRMGMSADPVKALEHASRTLRATTLARLEDALGWEPGSCEEVLRGGTFTPRRDESEQPADEAAEQPPTPVDREFAEGLMDLMDMFGVDRNTVLRALVHVPRLRQERDRGE